MFQCFTYHFSSFISNRIACLYHFSFGSYSLHLLSLNFHFHIFFVGEEEDIDDNFGFDRTEIELIHNQVLTILKDWGVVPTSNRNFEMANERTDYIILSYSCEDRININVQDLRILRESLQEFNRNKFEIELEVSAIYPRRRDEDYV